MEFRILGPLEVDQDGAAAAAKGRKPRALLGLLLLHRNQPVAPEQLIDDLWGDKAPATAANTLQVYVSQVRKIVADRLKTEGGAYRLRVEPDELDADRFERLAGEGATALGGKSYGRRGGAADRGPGPVAWPRARRPSLRLLRPGRDRAARGAPAGRPRGPDRSRAGPRPPRPAHRRARVARRGAADPRAAPHPPHARPLPCWTAGRGPRGLPAGPRDAPRGARARAGPRAAGPRTGDPATGRGALAAAAAPEQHPRAGQLARRPAARARGDHRRAARRHASVDAHRARRIREDEARHRGRERPRLRAHRRSFLRRPGRNP